MDVFLRFFFDFITQMLDGVVEIFSGIFGGIISIFNIPEYIRILNKYSVGFDIVSWILAVVAILIVLALWVAIGFIVVLLIRKYIRFRKTIVGQEDILEEIADLHRQVIKLTEEKDRIMALKVSQLGIPVVDIERAIASQEPEEQTEGSSFEETTAAVSETKSSEETASSTPETTHEAVRPAIDPSQSRFFRLTEVDLKYEFAEETPHNNTVTLPELCETIRNYACSRMRLYYDIRIIRLMISGMASSKLLLLQGISGTGKTSLPYCMGKFFTHDSTIASVQPSWRDRTELFGYFNEFTKKFNETEVLKRIYEATYTDDVNIIILDEMNIARVEYYFAEFLSILEMPNHDEWKMELVPNNWPTDPKHIKDGKILIPENVWYVGTANNDDSTFAVSDKVYDRALTINLDAKGIPFEAPDTDCMNVSYEHLAKLFKEAIASNQVSKVNLEKVAHLDVFIIQKMRIAFGNRIMKQLRDFVPVYVACGGKELDAIDYVLATKVFRKFESLNLSMIRDEIGELSAYLTKTFGKNTMNECQSYLERLSRLY